MARAHFSAPHFSAPHFSAPHFSAPHFSAPHFSALQLGMQREVVLFAAEKGISRSTPLPFLFVEGLSVFVFYFEKVRL